MELKYFVSPCGETHSLPRKFIERLEKRSHILKDQEKDILSVGLKFDLDLNTLKQDWIGGYYQSKEDALKTFKR